MTCELTASLLRLLTTGYGAKRARAYATDVRSWWKLTYERSGGIRVLTHLRHWRIDFVVMHNARPHLLYLTFREAKKEMPRSGTGALLLCGPI
jgi:hypothetical protein